MSDEQKTTTAPTAPAKTISAAELVERQRKDKTWKKQPWIDLEDGYEYRRQRVFQDGKFTEFNVRVGKQPRVTGEELEKLRRESK